jgi:hypothetical protein
MVGSQFQGNAMGRPHQERLVPVGVNILGGMHYSSSNAEARYNERLRRIKSGGGCGASVTSFTSYGLCTKAGIVAHSPKAARPLDQSDPHDRPPVCAHPTTFHCRLPPLLIIKFPLAAGDRRLSCPRHHRSCCAPAAAQLLLPSCCRRCHHRAAAAATISSCRRCC